VGFAAIVGSAVFNVFFVIAVCTLASSEPLQLTWWPLARDCTFYLLGLFLVVLVFSGTTPKKIEAWEAVLLFCWYICYCLFMVINEKAMVFVYKLLKIPLPGQEPDPQNGAGGASWPLASRSSESSVDPNVKPLNMKMPSHFRSGIISLMTTHSSISETVGIKAVTELKTNLKDTFKSIDTNGDGTLE